MDTYTSQVVINRPLNEVVNLFTDTNNFHKWQPHLEEWEVFEGEGLSTGSKARLVYKMDDHDNLKALMVVEENNLPKKIKLRYETDGMITHQSVRFKTIATNKTICIIDSDYNTSGLMNVVDFLNPKHFKKKSEDFLENFKNYAETEI